MLLQRVKSLELYKKWPIKIFCAAFVILAFVCIFFIIKPNAVHQWQGSVSFEEGVGAPGAPVYEGIALSPGVYNVELAYDTDTDFAGLCTVQDGTVITGGLLTNGEHLYRGRNATDYRMWLFEGTDAMQVVVSYEGTGRLETGALTIRETDQLWTMGLVMLLFWGCVILSILIFYYYSRRFETNLQKRRIFFWIAVISLLASFPCMYGSNVGGADLTYHLQRIEGVKDGLLSGHFPVRLEPEWLYGHGYADAVFYCNALLYLPALLRLAGFTVTTSYNIYCCALNIATVWIAWYCFSKIFKDDNIGLVCSALYTLSVMRIYKFLITGAVGEGSAFTFLPPVLYGLYCIFTKEPGDREFKRAWLPVALGYAGMIQTHVLTCEITAFLTLIICVVCIRRIFDRRVFKELAKGALAALAISLWYLAPFLDYYLTQDVHIKHVSARTIQERGLYPAQLAFQFWSVNSDAAGEGGMQYSDPMGVGFLLIFALSVFAAMWFGGVFRQGGRKDLIRLGKTSALLGAMLMLMSLNCFPWDRIQGMNRILASLVSSLQFPNRFLGWATLFLTVVFGFLLSYFSERKRYFYWLGLVAAIVSVSTSGLYLLDHVMLRDNSLELYNAEGMGVGYISGAEYLIEGTDESLLTYAGASTGDGVVLYESEKNYLNMKLSCANESDRESYLELPMLFYKGYRAHCAESGERLTVCDGTNHLVRIMLPAGFQGHVEAGFHSPFYWRFAEIISLVTATGLAVRLWMGRRRTARCRERCS